MRFTYPWSFLRPPEEGGILVPVLDVFLATGTTALVRERFLVDSGADMSMGPKWLCDSLGLTWQAGTPIEIRGISPRAECAVLATVHQVDLYIVEADLRVQIPFCFAEGDVPLLLGREGLFDAFRVSFDKRDGVTVFESC
jgi:hypothetical protein